jgi:hypothetical protein
MATPDQQKQLQALSDEYSALQNGILAVSVPL